MREGLVYIFADRKANFNSQSLHQGFVAIAQARLSTSCKQEHASTRSRIHQVDYGIKLTPLVKKWYKYEVARYGIPEASLLP